MLDTVLMEGWSKIKAFLSFYRHIEWLHLLSYFIIIVAEMLILWLMSGTPEANILRYIVFFGAVSTSLLLVRQRIIKPIQQMTQASLHIANGHYHSRLPSYSSIELNQMAQAFNQMANHLENIENQRVALIGNVAHELRTPLSNIRITLEGLIDEVFTPDTETFLEIQHEVSRLQRLVYQLERLSQAESGQIPLSKQLIAYADLIRSTCERLKVQYDSKGVELAYELSPDLPSLYLLDPDHITQVLINLLGNALQYTPSGGSVIVEAYADGKQIVTLVKDTGIGMQADELTHIFERFYRIDKSRARHSGGNGIGLTITRHLLLAHQGSISAHSAGLGCGSTFTFTLPY
ncbi:hypothetical protein MASR2M15_10860 [Anaerolineales bacterium]